MKLGIIVDSSSNMTKKEADSLGWYFLPLIININGKSYQDGIDLQDNIFYKLVTQDSQVSTATTPYGLVMEIFAKASKENDFVIVYGLSFKLSSQNANFFKIAEKFPNIFIIKSKIISLLIKDELLYAQKLFSKKIDCEKITDILQDRSDRSMGVLVPSNLNWLKKGGRINAATAAIGNLLNINPIIRFDGGLDKWGKSRTTQRAIKKGTELLFKEFKNHFQYTHYWVDSIPQIDSDLTSKGNKIMHNLQTIWNIKLIKTRMPRVIILHTFFNAMAVLSIPKR